MRIIPLGGVAAAQIRGQQAKRDIGLGLGLGRCLGLGVGNGLCLGVLLES